MFQNLVRTLASVALVGLTAAISACDAANVTIGRLLTFTPGSSVVQVEIRTY